MSLLYSKQNTVIAAVTAIVFSVVLFAYGVQITSRNVDVETVALFFPFALVYAIVPVAWTNRSWGESKLGLKEMGSRYLFSMLYAFLEDHLTRGDYRRQGFDHPVERDLERRRHAVALHPWLTSAGEVSRGRAPEERTQRVVPAEFDALGHAPSRRRRD